MLNTIFFLYHCAMASLNLVDCQSRFAIIGTDGEGVPISFPLGSDGLAVITTI